MLTKFPKNATSAVIIFSGGIDSTVALKIAEDSLFAIDEYTRPKLLAISFDYGQRHIKELQAGADICKLMEIRQHILDMSSFAGELPGNSLTDRGISTPHAHYDSQTMTKTVVPNRNLIMLSIAYAIASSRGYDVVGTGAYANEEGFYYPDTTHAFNKAFKAVAQLSLRDTHCPRLWTPFRKCSKADVISLGVKHRVQFQHTWTCYEGGEQACGKCGACVKRQEAFDIAGVSNPSYTHG